MPGKKMRSIKRPRTYEALKKRGMSKQSAARIANAQAAGTISRKRGKRGKKR